MSILVTGGTGYIGSHTVVELLQQGQEVVIVDNFSNSSQVVLDRIEQIVKKRPIFYQLDVADKVALRQVFENESITAVIHFAGYKVVSESIAKPVLYYENNLISTLSLVDVMAEFGVKQLVFSSSANVYGVDNPAPLTESMPTSTTNPYGYTKIMLEQILHDVAAADKDFRIAILRYFNPVGAHISGLIGESPLDFPNNLMPFIAQVAAGKQEYLHVFGNDYDTVDGTGVRDYIHVVDLALGHIKALEKLQMTAGVWTYNLGTGQGTSVLEFIRAFERVNQISIPYQIVERRPGDIGISYANTDKAHKELNWQTHKTIEDMCRDTWRWQLQNPNGYN